MVSGVSDVVAVSEAAVVFELELLH